MDAKSKAIFRVAREIREPDDRAQYVAEACGGNEALRLEVAGLLVADARGNQVVTIATSAQGEHAASTDETIGADELAAANMPGEEPGQQIGPYRLLQEIGEGGFGSVWLAEQRAPVRRQVALKIIKLGMDTKQVIARFEAERQALALMDHPNIAKVLDAGATATGRPYFAMELVRGTPIVKYCDEHALDTRARLDLFVKVCNALQHAHQKGIIHRDIKPSNVLVALHDGVPTPKVIDFGIAKATNAELTQHTVMTEHRQVIGTPAYMSPEQAEMSGLDIDTRADIYSLGVLLYELLTGTTPFDPESLRDAGFAEMLRVIREEEPHKPSTRLSVLGATAAQTAATRKADARRLATLLRGDLDWIVMKCLEKERGRRYETANALGADVLRHLRDEPVSAGPPTTGYRLQKFVKRNRAGVLAGATFSVLILGALVGMTVLRWQALSAQADAERAAHAAEVARAAEAKQREIAEAQVGVAERALGDIVAQLRTDAVVASAVANEDAVSSLARTAGGLVRDLMAAREQARAAAEEAAEAARRAEALAADEAAARSEAQRELARATEIKGLMTEMLQSIDPAEARGADTTLLKGILDEAAQRLAAGEINDALVAAELRDVIGEVYRRLGLYEESGKHLPAAVALRERELGGKHPATLAARHHLANLHAEQGRYDDAEALYADTLTTRRAVLGDDHPDTLETRRRLASLYGKQGRLAEAESLQVETLASQERVLGPEHPDTLASMNSLGVLYQRQDRHAEAEVLHVRTLAARKRVLGTEHPDTLASMGNLALAHYFQGHYHEAEAALRELIEVMTRVRGVEHPSTLMSMNNLASVYFEQGRFADAERLHRRALEVRRRVLGDEHPQTVQSLHNVGLAVERQGRTDEAEPLFAETLAVRRRALGNQHPYTLAAMNTLAAVYRAQGRAVDAETLYTEALNLRRKHFGADHPETFVAMTNLALLYIDVNRHNEAAALLEASYPGALAAFGVADARTIAAARALANAYEHIERSAEAQALYEELLRHLRAALEELPPDDANRAALETWIEETQAVLRSLRDGARSTLSAQTP